MKSATLAVRAGLQDAFPAVHVATATPDTIDGPTVRIQRSGGSSHGRLDHPQFFVDCLDVSEAAADDLAESVRDWFAAVAHTTVDGLTVTLVDVPMGPRPLPWGNPGVWRLGARYQLYCT